MSYELVYFDGRARAEPSRLAFIVAGKKFTDTRITFDDWPNQKPKAPQGRLPYLKVGDKTLSQSQTILRYLGEVLDLYGGNDSFQRANVNQVIDTCVDLMAAWEKAVFGGKEDTEKAKLKEEFKKDSVPKFYPMLENLLKENKGKGYAVGDKITIADLMLFNAIESCNALAGEGLDKYPCLQANRALVEKNEKIAAYLKTRKQTDF